ncbi:MAG: hypothetical protein WD845_00330 [Pirellulales bacterium]
MSTSGAAGAAAVIIQAVKASGVIVQVEPEAFLEIVARQDSPLVVCAPGTFFHRLRGIHCQYVTGYKGLAFYTRSAEHLSLPETTEVVLANTIWIPM